MQFISSKIDRFAPGLSVHATHLDGRAGEVHQYEEQSVVLPLGSSAGQGHQQAKQRKMVGLHYSMQKFCGIM